MKKVGLVLEGGSMRSIYTAGVLDVLLNNNINVDVIIGVSAGALFGVNFFSRQIGRVLRYNLKYCKDLRYMSISSWLLTGNLVNKKFAYYKLSEELDPFDDETFMNSNKEFYVTVTNLQTGLPEYIKINSCINDMELLRATSAMPLVSEIININNKKYLDGAISDSIPLKKMESLDVDKIIVIQTRDDSYRKEPYSTKRIREIEKKYKNYPNFIEDFKNRHNMYNETLDYIKKAENNHKVFVIKPSKPLDINVIERNRKKIKRVYDLGVKDALSKIDDLKKYLS